MALGAIIVNGNQILPGDEITLPLNVALNMTPLFDLRVPPFKVHDYAAGLILNPFIYFVETLTGPNPAGAQTATLAHKVAQHPDLATTRTAAIARARILVFQGAAPGTELFPTASSLSNDPTVADTVSYTTNVNSAAIRIYILRKLGTWRVTVADPTKTKKLQLFEAAGPAIFERSNTDYRKATRLQQGWLLDQFMHLLVEYQSVATIAGGNTTEGQASWNTAAQRKEVPNLLQLDFAEISRPSVLADPAKLSALKHFNNLLGVPTPAR